MTEQSAAADQPPNLNLTAYEITPDERMIPEPGERERRWMTEANEGFARRCLPLLMANQSGWIIRNNQTVRLRWNGKPHPGALKIEYEGDAPYYAVGGDFGSGIVSWRMPFLFRTPPGYNLLVRGPANLPKDGIQALEGLVETDWAESSFTMNWKITRPKHWITFEAGEPICQLVPMRRGDLEAMRAQVVPIAQDPPVAAGFQQFRDDRLAFIQALDARDPEATAEGWQKDYFRGQTRSGITAPDHQTRLQLHPFERAQIEDDDTDDTGSA